MNAGVIIFVLLLVLAFLGLPIYLSIGIATMVAMVHAGFPLEAIAQKTFLGMNSSSLLCIPLFILAGNIMAQGITQKLINAANVPLGRVRGSLASVTVLSSALFGAISGSGVATTASNLLSRNVADILVHFVRDGKLGQDLTEELDDALVVAGRAAAPAAAADAEKSEK